MGMAAASYNTGDIIATSGSSDTKLLFIARGAVLSTQVRWSDLDTQQR